MRVYLSSIGRRPSYPFFPFFFSPASDAGVLPPLWRGRVFPFTVQSRDHLATITDIYVPSFSYVHSPAFNAGFYFVHCAMENCLDLAIRTGGAAGSDAPTQTLIRRFRRTGRPADTLAYKSHTRVGVYILRKGCPPVRLVYPLPSIFFEFWRKDRHKKTSLKFRDSFGNDGTISILKRYSQMILL